MKRALISPNEIPQYVADWKSQSRPVLQPVPEAHRVVAVLPQDFSVSEPFFWVDCNDNVEPDLYYYQTTTHTILPMPKSKSRPVVSSRLVNNIGETETVLTLIDASAFPSAGEIKIGQEVMVYHGKDGNKLLNVIRATQETTAKIHTVGATVTLTQ